MPIKDHETAIPSIPADGLRRVRLEGFTREVFALAVAGKLDVVAVLECAEILVVGAEEDGGVTGGLGGGGHRVGRAVTEGLVEVGVDELWDGEDGGAEGEEGEKKELHLVFGCLGPG